MSSKVRVRFAPSPTGPLHIGGVRTALYNYLFAKQHGGDFILRIEDTDSQRFVPGAEDYIIEALTWLGLKFDEGTHIGGEYGPYRQSDRKEIYKKYVDQLLEKGAAYIAFDTPEELQQKRQEIENFQYDASTRGQMRNSLTLPKEEVQSLIDNSTNYVVRFKIEPNEDVVVNDLIRGKVTINSSELDDKVLYKSADNLPTYHLANIVDDHLMGITHVVRGNEYLSSSPKYNRLYDAFGWEVPVYVHCPLITNEEHKKLSKRSGHASYEDLIDQGFLTESVINFVALLGWSPEDNNEFFTLDELVKEFDYHHMSKTPAVFDMTKLRWMNGEYLKKMDFDKFYEMALPHMKEVVSRDVNFEKLASMIKTRIEIWADIKDQIDFIEQVPDYDINMYVHKKNKTNLENSLEVLKEVQPLLEKQEDYSNDALFELLGQYAKDKEKKVGFVMWPIRVALSGKQMTPGGATELMEVLGKEESLARIQTAIDRLSQEA